ncbi:MAG: preprotein translocase subunit SecE [Candidatus Dojkabacteria bacterium]
MKIIKNIVNEAKNTKWPTLKEVAVMTIYTIIVCGIISLIMVGLDLVLAKLRDLFLNM